MPQTSQKQSLLQRIFYPHSAGGYQVFMEYVRVIGIALIIALVFRTFIASPYKIPSSSMMPTLLVGDYLFVSKYSYGVPIPFSGGQRMAVKSPERGDVAVFKKKLPLGGEQNYIKRVIALPGDLIAFKNQQIILNGVPLEVEPLEDYRYSYQGRDVQGRLQKETLNGVSYLTLLQNSFGQNVAEMRVPPGHFVLMGDNRDSSYDSRFWHYPSWGFVAMEDIVGRAEFIFWSWGERMKPRLARLGRSLRTTHTEPALAINMNKE